MQEPTPPPGEPKFILKDKEDELTIDQQFAGATPNRILDKFAVIIHLLEMRLKWTHTNIQNNQILMRILQARTWTRIAHETYRPLWDNNSPELSDIERQSLKDYFEQTHRTMLAITDDYAELRVSAKGFRAKQIERIMTGDARTEKELDRIFKGKDQEVK